MISPWTWLLSLAAAFTFGHFNSLAWDWHTLRIHVEVLMRTVPGSLWHRERVCEGKALLACRGHRMTKRTRDALTVWLAEQGDS